jgi:histidinol-phosphate aminotransferase
MTHSLGSPERYDLRDNVNAWGPPPSARAVLSALGSDALSRYPGQEGGRLLPVLARFLGVAEDELAVGCGSDQLLDAAFRLAAPGSELRYAAPTFSMVPVYARANRLVPCRTPMGPDGPRNAAALLPERGGGIVYLCSPNNPTGTVIPPPTIEWILAQAPPDTLVVLDAAYAEFSSQPDWVAAAVRSDRCLLLRTFSKAWGLAGLRAGYAVGAASLIARLRSLGGPYPLNAVAEAVIAGAIELDNGWMRARARNTVVLRDWFLARLKAMGFEPWPSHANFILIPVRRAAAVATALGREGIAVRSFSDLEGIGEAIRVGIGPWPVLERCLRVLRGAVP